MASPRNQHACRHNTRGIKLVNAWWSDSKIWIPASFRKLDRLKFAMLSDDLPHGLFPMTNDSAALPASSDGTMKGPIRCAP